MGPDKSLSLEAKGRTQLLGFSLVSMLEHLATKSHYDKAVRTAPPTAVSDQSLLWAEFAQRELRASRAKKRGRTLYLHTLIF